LEKLLLETDCPVVYQGHRSEPADVTRSLQAVADLKGLPRTSCPEDYPERHVSLRDVYRTMSTDTRSFLTSQPRKSITD